MVTIGTLVLTLFLYVIVPKGFFPIEDTGRHSRHLRGAADGLVRQHGAAPAEACRRHPERSRRRKASLRSSASTAPIRPSTAAASRSTSSRWRSASDRVPDIIQRLQSKLKNVEGITLYMQPLQDLTVADAVSRTQYQYSLESADANELTTWTNEPGRELRKHPAAYRRRQRHAEQGPGDRSGH